MNFPVGGGARHRMAAKVGFRLGLLAGEGAETIVVQEYSARELGVKPGEAVIVEDARHSWLLVRNARGERGWIPERNTETMD